MTLSEGPDRFARGEEDSKAEPLVDFPLRFEGEPVPLFAAPERPLASAATLGPRLLAFAGDAAASVLAVSLGLLGGAAASGRTPRAEGLLWAGAFGIYFSFVLVVLSLTLFGRTVGMALAGLEARPGPAGKRLLPGEAVRRWIGTVFAAATAGAPLFWTARDPAAPTPADRFSGRALVAEEALLDS